MSNFVIDPYRFVDPAPVPIATNLSSLINMPVATPTPYTQNFTKYINIEQNLQQ